MSEATRHLAEYDTAERFGATVVSSERITPEASSEEVRELAREFGLEVKDSWLEEGRLCSAFVRARRPE